MTQCNIDFSPLFRSSIGYDHLSRMMDAALVGAKTAPNYPPYNIEKNGDNQYRITMAVAGFSEGELDLTQKDNMLIVTGQKMKDPSEGCDAACGTEVKYLHRGIGTRNFESKFQLADHVRITSAQLKDGLLNISLLREVPEEKKPRSIKIESAAA